MLPSASGLFENFSDALNSIDDIQDLIYRAGVESGPLFKKTKQQCFSFRRRYFVDFTSEAKFELIFG